MNLREETALAELQYYRQNPSVWLTHLRPSPNPFQKSRKTIHSLWNEEVRALWPSLPGNFFESYSYWDGQKPLPYKEIVSHEARMLGWLRDGVNYAPLKRFVRHCCTPKRGVNSPYQANLHAIADRFVSPGGFATWIRRVRWRANLILRNTGVSVSWKILAQVAERGPCKVGKAAVVAAAATIAGVDVYHYKGYGYHYYRQLLSVLLGSGEIHTDDGVEIREISREYYRGITVIYGVKREGFRRNIIALVKGSGRTYHEHIYGSELAIFLSGKTEKLTRECTRKCVALALRAWKEQKRLERSEGRDFPFERFMPLVYISDSIKAGNCLAGTEAFIRETGISGNFIPLQQLIEIAQESGETRVMNVVKQVVSESLSLL